MENENCPPSANLLRKISLSGDLVSLKILKRIFDEEDLFVFTETHLNIDFFFMRSKLFENLNENELRKAGNDLIKKVNSICSFMKDNYIPVKIENVYIGECAYIYIEEKIEIREDVCIIENGKEKDFDGDEIKKVFSKINNDKLLYQIMILLFDKGANWVNLYRILDFFKEDNLISHGWISRKDLKLLKQTANSYSAIGSEARHGDKKKFEPPKNPMPLAMAQVLVKKIIWYYIKSLDEKL
jgi:hypothetical protein